MRFNALVAAAFALLAGACLPGSLDDLSKGGPHKPHTGGQSGQSPDAGPDAAGANGGGVGAGGGGSGGTGPILPACEDHMLGADETDLDCGGPCPPCEIGSKCKVNADCAGRLHRGTLSGRFVH
jgi:hypothetical protein